MAPSTTRHTFQCFNIRGRTWTNFEMPTRKISIGLTTAKKFKRVTKEKLLHLIIIRFCVYKSLFVKRFYLAQSSVRGKSSSNTREQGTKKMNVEGILFILIKFSFNIIVTFIDFEAIFLFLSPIFPPKRKRQIRMSDFIKPKRLTSEKEISLFSRPLIKPLLSKKMERPENLIFDIMKYEYSKFYCLPVQLIKTETQNAEEVKTDFVSNDEVAAELGFVNYKTCSHLTYKADIQNAK